MSGYPDAAHKLVNISISATGWANAYSLAIKNNTSKLIKYIDAASPTLQQDISGLATGTCYITMIDNGTKTIVAKSKSTKL